MDRIYQPQIIEISDIIIESLEIEGFFKEYEIKSTDVAKKIICDNLTEKFILGEIDLNDDEYFNEVEFEKILKMIVAGSILGEMKEKGWINSYEDEDTEEMFFLTEEGKKQLKVKYDDDNTL